MTFRAFLGRLAMALGLCLIPVLAAEASGASPTLAVIMGFVAGAIYGLACSGLWMYRAMSPHDDSSERSGV
jgi:hypothetical protein